MADWIDRNIIVSRWLLRGCSFRRGAIAAAAVLVLSWTPALAQFVQQGPKLVGAGANVPPNAAVDGPGKSAALSADGNTAIVGDPEHNNQDGAAWIFVRHNGVWTQQARLVGTGAIGALVAQGDAVALSADGNTAVVGGPGDNNGVGAAWIFTRSFSGLSSVATWAQRGKLVGTNPVGASKQGSAVALSADGTTVLVGGGFDNGRMGAVWVFARTVVSNPKGTFVEWLQQGSKLTAGNEVGNGWFGNSVALSADGNTAAVGAVYDNNGVGAAWIFARTPGTVAWVQGPKLIASNAIGTAKQGTSVALSGDGNTAIVGGFSDNNETGAAWVFARKTVFTLGGNVVEWVQQEKLVGKGATGPVIDQGSSVALSADGNTAMVGGVSDNWSMGAAWVFTRSTAGSSVNPVATWTPQGSKLVGTNGVGDKPLQGSPVALSADGNTALSAGNGDNDGVGAAWIFAQKPTVESVSPGTVFLGGGGKVTINGTGFTGASAVTFGGVPAANLVAVDPTTITVTPPPHAAGTVDVAVTNSNGTGIGTGLFHYVQFVVKSLP